MIEAVIFDYGGVVAGKAEDAVITNENGKKASRSPSLERVAQRLRLSYSELLQEIGSDIPRLQRGEIEEKLLWERTAAKYNLQLPPDYDSLMGEDFMEIYHENPGVTGIISALRKQGTLVGLLSNTIAAHAAINEQAGRFDKFDFKVLSHLVRARKPEERIYQVALEILKYYSIAPDNCVYIDDIASYLEPAKKLGLNTINYRNDEHDVNVLKEGLHRLGLKLT